MNQAAIDFAAPPAQRHSRTSCAAAASVAPKAGTKRAIVLDFLKARGDDGATNECMQWNLRMGSNTQRPRRVELVTAGLVVDSGRTGKTQGGHNAVIWMVAGAQG